MDLNPKFSAVIALAAESSAIISTKSQTTPKRRVPRTLAIVRGQNDILHHHTRLTLDRLLLERFRLDDELSEAVAAVNMLSPRRHYSIEASWKYLLAVSASENRKKGDKGPDRYMPPNTAYHCEYVKVWTKIKRDWELEMTEAEGEDGATDIGDMTR